MVVTTSFFRWWYEAANIGGWVLFFFIAVAAVVWLLFDTQTRRIRAVGWLIGAILPVLLLLPSAILGFSPPTRDRMPNLLEVFFYLGLIGSIVPVIVSVGYGVIYRGMRGCEKGHVFEASLGECPICAQEKGSVVSTPSAEYTTVQEPVASQSSSLQLLKRAKPKVRAWLVDERSNRTHQLSRGDTRVGRSKTANDVIFTDKAVSREHLLIREEQGYFTIFDRGSKTGTYINGSRVDSPLLLAHDDVIELGNTRLRFVTSQLQDELWTLYRP